MTPQLTKEQMDAKARLAASNVRTLADATAGGRAGDDTYEAFIRFQTVFPGQLIDFAALLRACVIRLQTSDLTINVKSTTFLGEEVTGDTYGNCWSRSAGSALRNNVEQGLID